MSASIYRSRRSSLAWNVRRTQAWAAGFRLFTRRLLLLGLLAGPYSVKETAAVTFTDQTVAAGLTHSQSVAGYSDVKIMTGGVAARDFDGDGWVDLVFTRIDANPILYRNMGNGTFTNVTATSGIVMATGSNGVGWGDIDNDGDPDLYMTRANFQPSGTHQLFINQGNGTFVDQTTQRGVGAGGASDFFFGTSVCFGDYNRDGWLDIHVNEWGGEAASPFGTNHIKLFKNRGHASPGHFLDKTNAAGVSMTGTVGYGCVKDDMPGTWAFSSRFTDLDLDGDPDLVVACDFTTSRIYRNNGDETFTDVTSAAGVGTDENGMGLTVGDYNGDGLQDIFITSIYHTDPPCVGHNEDGNFGVTGNRLFKNQGGLVFTDETDSGVRDGQWGWGASFFDMDHDGDLDLAMTNGYKDFGTGPMDFTTDTSRIFENNGDETFTDVSASVGVTDSASGKGLLTFDYDKDGDLDLLIVNNEDTPILYRNDGGNASNWIMLELEGTESTRDAIGARVIVTGNGNVSTQYREVDGGSNYLSQNDIVMHVGLGNSTLVDKIRIEWPSGNVQELSNVAVNQRLQITEVPTGGSLSISVENDLATLKWTSRWLLKQSDDLDSWTPFSTATSPHEVPTNGAAFGSWKLDAP